MTRSMSGYASASFKTRKLTGKLSIKTLNHRYFDWLYRGPDWGDLELELRSLAQAKINRGRVEVWLELASRDSSDWEVALEEGLAHQLVHTADKLEKAFQRPFPLSADTLFKIPQLVVIKRKDIDINTRGLIKKAFIQALKRVIAQREEEGRKLASVIRASLLRLEQSLERIKRIHQQEKANWQTRIEIKMKEILSHKPLDERRLEEEVAYLLVRGDVQEEISRVEAHLISLRKILSQPAEAPKGREVDFLAQELLREVSTLSSKSLSLKMVQEGLKMKSEIESIRQQGQNIE